MQQTQTSPKLQKPGAGLPFLEALYVRWMVPRLANKTSWEDADKLFQSQAEKILKDVENLNAEELSKPVLIDRLRGLEDSSRFWSVAMTMEHIGIVTEGMTEIAVRLARGESLDVTVDVAKVKPQKAWPVEQSVDLFKKMVARTQERFQNEIRDRKSPLSHGHPWFGKLTAHQWHFLMASHLTIHKTQIRKILEGLKSGKVALS